MYRKIALSLLVFALLLSVSGCRRNKETPAPVSESAMYVTPAPATPSPTPYTGAVMELAPEDYEFFDPDSDITVNEPSQIASPAPDSNSTPSPTPTEAPDNEEPPDETEPTTPPAVPVTEYEAYNAMSAEDQMAFYESFDSMADFVAWYNNAQAEYEATHSAIEVGDGNIDLSEIINAQS